MRKIIFSENDREKTIPLYEVTEQDFVAFIYDPEDPTAIGWLKRLNFKEWGVVAIRNNKNDSYSGLPTGSFHEVLQTIQKNGYEPYVFSSLRELFRWTMDTLSF